MNRYISQVLLLFGLMAVLCLWSHYTVHHSADNDLPVLSESLPMTRNPAGGSAASTAPSAPAEPDYIFTPTPEPPKGGGLSIMMGKYYSLGDKVREREQKGDMTEEALQAEMTALRNSLYGFPNKAPVFSMDDIEYHCYDTNNWEGQRTAGLLLLFKVSADNARLSNQYITEENQYLKKEINRLLKEDKLSFDRLCELHQSWTKEKLKEWEPVFWQCFDRNINEYLSHYRESYPDKSADIDKYAAEYKKEAPEVYRDYRFLKDILVRLGYINCFMRVGSIGENEIGAGIFRLVRKYRTKGRLTDKDCQSFRMEFNKIYPMGRTGTPDWGTAAITMEYEFDSGAKELNRLHKKYPHIDFLRD